MVHIPPRWPDEHIMLGTNHSGHQAVAAGWPSARE
jgi:hypothetical protein